MRFLADIVSKKKTDLGWFIDVEPLKVFNEEGKKMNREQYPEVFIHDGCIIHLRDIGYRINELKEGEEITVYVSDPVHIKDEEVKVEIETLWSTERGNIEGVCAYLDLDCFNEGYSGDDEY